MLPTSSFASVQDIHDYCAQHIENGNAEMPMGIDRRGLSYLNDKNNHDVHLALPLEGEGTISDGKVLLRAVF